MCPCRETITDKSRNDVRQVSQIRLDRRNRKNSRLPRRLKPKLDKKKKKKNHRTDAKRTRTYLSPLSTSAAN